MFSVHLKCIYRTCNVIIARELRSKVYNPQGANPGLQNRIRVFGKEGLPLPSNDNDVEEFVEQSESDFYQVGEAYSEHLNETLMGKHELKQHIVKDKYFKENMPNLLTWSEKEQIRHLHNEHPDEWTLEKIAESFPVTVAVVKKLLKYPWKPASEQRIARHDASAMRNWKDLKDGTLDISQDIREHFLKFSNRTIPPLKKGSIKIDLTQEKKIGEFEQIVQRCATQSASNKNSLSLNDQNIGQTNNSAQDKIRKDKNRLTLEELTEKIKSRIETGRNVDMPDKIILSTIKTNTTPEVKPLENIASEIELTNTKSNEIIKHEHKDTESEKSIMEYPERIHIPKKAYKRGAIYKVNDCYYDYDGKFLYRVLGMSN